MSTAMKRWGWLWRLIKLRKKSVGVAIILTMASYLLGTLYPVAIQKVIDRTIQGSFDVTTLLIIVIAFASLVGEIVFGYFRHKKILDLGIFLDKRIVRIITIALFASRRLEAAHFDQIHSHFVEATKVRDFILYRLPDFLFNIGGAIAAVLLLFYYDVLIATVTLMLVPVTLRFGSSYLEKSRISAYSLYEASGERQRLISETVGSIQAIKASSLEKFQLSRLEKSVDRYLVHLRDMIVSNLSYWVLTQSINRIGSLLVIIVGCYRLHQGLISFGDLLAIQILLGRILGPLVALGDISKTWSEVSVASDKISVFLSSPRDRFFTARSVRKIYAANFAIDNVSYTYDSKLEHALRGVSIDLPSKGFVAVVGRNGSGKSTFIKLLLALKSDYTGSIKIGGSDLRSYPPRWFRSQVSAIGQTDVLLGDSIREMICQYKTFSDSEISEALHFASASSIPASVHGGIDGRILGGASSLSGGQRQKLGIARSYLRRPRIAIFDEATSALDAESARSIERRILSWSRDRLVVFVTHNLSLAAVADKIVVFDDGKLVGEGHHNILINNNAVYMELFRRSVSSVCDGQQDFHVEKSENVVVQTSKVE